MLAANLKAQYIIVGQQAVIATSGLNLRAAARTTLRIRSSTETNPSAVLGAE